MPQSSLDPKVPHFPVAAPSLDYTRPVNPKDFKRALDTNFEGEIQGLIGGALQFDDGSSFRIDYVTSGGVSRLRMARQVPEAASGLMRVWHGVLDNFGVIGSCRKAIHGNAHKAQALAQSIKPKIGLIVDKLWSKELSLQLHDKDETLDSRQIDAWLGSPDRNGIIQQHCVEAAALTEDKLTVTFRHGEHTQQLCFRASSYREEAMRARASRDLNRLARVVNGQYAKSMGAFRSAREMMAIFKAATVMEEGKLAIRELARQRVPVQSDIANYQGALFAPQGSPSAMYLSAMNSHNAIALDTESVIETAVWLCSGELLSQAATAARSHAQFPLESAQVAASQGWLDYHTQRMFSAAQRTISTSLRDHSLKALSGQIRCQSAASEDDVRLLRKHGKRLGHDDRMFRKRQLPPHYAKVSQPDAPRSGTDYVTFFRKLNPAERLARIFGWRRSESDVKEGTLAPSSTAVVRGEGRFAPRQLYKVWFNRYPECVRFPLAGSAVDRTNMPALATTTSYVGFDHLARDVYQTLYDDRMHAIAKSVRQTVDEQVVRMRSETRAQLEQERLNRLHRNSFVNSRPPSLKDEEWSRTTAGFERGLRCAEIAGITAATPNDVRKNLLKVYVDGLLGEKLKPQSLSRASRAAYEAGQLDRSILEPDMKDAAAMQELLYRSVDAFKAGLYPAPIARLYDIEQQATRVLGRLDGADDLARALVDLRHTGRELKRAEQTFGEVEKYADAWDNLARKGDATDANGRRKAYLAATEARAAANVRLGELHGRYFAIIAQIEGICIAAGLESEEAKYVASSLAPEGQMRSLLPPPDRRQLSTKELQEREEALRMAAARAAPFADELGEILDRREEELRGRAALMVVGRATLSDFDRWAKEELTFALRKNARVDADTSRVAVGAHSNAAPSIVHSGANGERPPAGVANPVNEVASTDIQPASDHKPEEQQVADSGPKEYETDEEALVHTIATMLQAEVIENSATAETESALERRLTRSGSTAPVREWLETEQGRDAAAAL